MVARLGFKHRATAVLKSNLIPSIEFGTAVARHLKWVSCSLFSSLNTKVVFGWIMSVDQICLH